jgi:hypothetical protein
VLFTITSAPVGVFQSTLVDPGASVNVATPNISDPLTQPAQVAVTATVNNVGDTGPISATAATYTSNPTGGNVINVGGGYVDLKVAGADANDSATTKWGSGRSSGYLWTTMLPPAMGCGWASLILSEAPATLS